jgi:hypothetical protein
MRATLWWFCLLAFPVGAAGATAFNPDRAVLFESEALWRVFGLYCYFGIPALLAIASYALARLLTRSR